MAHGFYRWVGQDRNVTEAQYVSSGKSLSGSDLYGWGAGNSFYRDDIREECKQLTEKNVPVKESLFKMEVFGSGSSMTAAKIEFN